MWLSDYRLKVIATKLLVGLVLQIVVLGLMAYISEVIDWGPSPLLIVGGLVQLLTVFVPAVNLAGYVRSRSKGPAGLIMSVVTFFVTVPMIFLMYVSVYLFLVAILFFRNGIG